ncbi:MAG: BatA and WFA domain-containing protein, partial [Planctomycetes bacterium]|nr:BatA and WFA domain-containing protein [Planctomycetota bacterium]
MSWGNPAAAWFLLAIPVVVLLYFLRLKRREVVVSSTLLWSRVLEDKRVNSPFQRFRRTLLLLLQILALLFFAGALARPEVESASEMPRTHILLMDVSASMAAADGGESRLERARTLAGDYIDALSGGERAVVIRFARRAKALTPITNDRRVLHGALAALALVPGPTDIDDALRLSLSVARSMSSQAQGTS